MRERMAFAPAMGAIGRCVGRSLRLLAERRVHVPRRHVGRTLVFADGSRSTVYRETVLDGEVQAPCVLLVEFRLRWLRGRWHRAFEWESWLNTPLFVGFPGFASKLWLTADNNGYYRGLYEWDGPGRAEYYARALWWALIVVSERGSIRYQVLPQLTRDAFVRRPSTVDDPVAEQWWQLVST